MNENLNLVEILKDCPKGTKLYSTAFGDVYFYGISDNKEYPICIAVAGNSDYRTLTYDGKLWRDYGGECILFPSREQRDWSKFNPKKDWFVPPCEFKDGDIVATYTGNWIGITTGGCAHSFIPTYCVLSRNREVKLYFGRKEEWGFERLATEEEKQKLFQAIKDNGYKWNAETKTLEKLVKPKFDPKTLKPFDKILVKDRVIGRCSRWMCTFFSYYDERKFPYPCRCAFAPFEVCIPYNDETKYLVGTDDEAPEYYRYWED